MKKEKLMEIGKLTLETEDWGEVKTIQFSHEEIQYDSWYGNEVIETEISRDDAIRLIGWLTEFYGIDDK